MQLPPFKWEPNLGAHQIKVPQEIGNGSIKLFRLNCGMQLVVMDYRLRKTTVLEYAPPFNSLGVEFCLSGLIEAHLSSIKDALTAQPGQSSLHYSPDNDSFSEVVFPERVLRLGIMLEHEQLSTFIGENGDSLPIKFQGKHQTLSRYDGLISPQMHNVIQQVLRCPFQGMTRNLFLESKTLELMAYVMEQVVHQDNRRVGSPSPKPNDVERVRHAALLLADDLEKTPDLNELAKSVGMCRSKLHHCFRMVHGVTPFDYLRSHRLEAAMHYLAEGEMNITEVAYKVGYSSSSYFTKAFKKHFGLPPSQCKKVSLHH